MSLPQTDLERANTPTPGRQLHTGAAARPGDTAASTSASTSGGASGGTSADRVLELLLELISRDSVGVVEAAEHLGVSRPTAHRLLATLVRHGMAAQDHHGGRYSLGLRFAMLTARSPRSLLLESARREVLALREETGETCHFGVLQGNSSRFVLGFQGALERSTPSRVGVVLPAHATAIGKAILAALPPESMHNLYPRGVHVLTDVTLGSKEKIDAHLREVARRGYATNLAESEPGLSAVAVVVRGADGSPVGAVAVSGPADRLRSERLPSLAARIQRSALDIQSTLAMQR